jgi:hypothetical protein
MRRPTSGSVSAMFFGCSSQVQTIVPHSLSAQEIPVRVEFLGEDHRQRGLHTLAELQPIDGYRDFAVGCNLQEG